MEGDVDHSGDKEVVTIRRSTVERALFAILALFLSAFLGILTYMARDMVGELRSLRHDFSTIAVWQSRIDAVLTAQQEHINAMRNWPDREDYNILDRRVKTLENLHNR